MSNHLSIPCPCCGKTMVIDLVSKRVVSHGGAATQKMGDIASFLKEDEARVSSLEEQFRAGADAQKNRLSSLEDGFIKASKDPTTAKGEWFSPFDLD